MWMDNYWFLFSEVNKWMEELDRRHSSKVAGKSSTPCKVRMEGAPANSLPPKDAPEWAVDPNWSKVNGYTLAGITSLLIMHCGD